MGGRSGRQLLMRPHGPIVSESSRRPEAAPGRWHLGTVVPVQTVPEHMELALPDKGIQALSILPPRPLTPASLPHPSGNMGCQPASVGAGGRKGFGAPKISRKPGRQSTHVLRIACVQSATRQL